MQQATIHPFMVFPWTTFSAAAEDEDLLDNNRQNDVTSIRN